MLLEELKNDLALIVDTFKTLPDILDGIDINRAKKDPVMANEAIKEAKRLYEHMRAAPGWPDESAWLMSAVGATTNKNILVCLDNLKASGLLKHPSVKPFYDALVAKDDAAIEDWRKSTKTFLHMVRSVLVFLMLLSNAILNDKTSALHRSISRAVLKQLGVQAHENRL